MVSAQVGGKLTFYRITPTGSKVNLFSGATAQLGPSGSSDGAIASTPDTWTFIPLQNAPNKVLNVNDKLQVTFEATATATIDASDCEFIIPITLKDGTIQTIGSPDSSIDWDAKVGTDIAYVGGVEAVLCEKTIRQPFALGSNVQKCFLSVENNA